ncbi:MAG: hypothetical protein ACI9EF_003119 [Pseudohongiellaceae bacterium]
MSTESVLALYVQMKPPTAKLGTIVPLPRKRPKPMNMMALIILTAAAVLGGLIVAAVKVRNHLRRQAQRLGYPSLSAYLRAAPRTDEEKREAVSMGLAGLILCLLGLVLPPFMLIGLFPLFYGARKVAWASMGLGLVDDADLPGA